MATWTAAACCSGALLAQEAPFSGPQPGEPLPACAAKGVFDAAAGTAFDPVAQAAGKPLLLIFVHDANRPSIAFARVLADYAATRAADGLAQCVLWLADDPAAAEEQLRRMRHALPKAAPLGIADGGREGPGALALNRNVTLTIVLAKGGKVAANFALVQPSLQADLPKVLASVCALVGGVPPKVADLPGMPAKATAANPANERLRPLLRPVIRKDAAKEDVAAAIAALEAVIAKDAEARKELGRIARTIVDAGVVANYGTPPAQEQLRKWADQHGGPAKSAAPKAAEKVIALLLAAACAADGIDFDTQVVPVLTRAGCNAGACHGAAAGRGGLRLSLWGSDPAGDRMRLAFEFAGRRVNRARPERSLLLRKPTGGLPHEGGTPLDAAGAEIVKRWIAAGAPAGGARKLLGLSVESPTLRDSKASGVGQAAALQVTARFGDSGGVFRSGAGTDVTRWTALSADDGAVRIVRAGALATATPLRPGRHIVLARYLDQVTPFALVVPFGAAPVDLTKEPRAGFIDAAALKTLAELRIAPAPPASDAVFVRRVHLDLAGALPTPEIAAAFAASAEPSKRANLVAQLLDSPGFVTRWTHWLATLVRNRGRGDADPGAAALHEWLRREVRRGTRMDRTAAALVAATGDAHAVGPAHFARLPADPRGHAELVAEAFLGLRLQCANCHNHPLDRWTQDDYHGFAAAFARVDRGRQVGLLPRGEVTHPRTGLPAVPRLLGGELVAPGGDPRAAVAAWLARPDPPRFAKAFVNRVWAELLGRGLVAPADDLRDTNPASHPELLDELAADFAAHDHDLRQVVRRIATSAAYARGPASLPVHARDDRFLSHARPRPLPAEILADAWTNVLGIGSADGAVPAEGSALAAVDPAAAAPALDLLGRCSRQSSCAGAANRAGSLAAQLQLLNGKYLNERLGDPRGRLAKLRSAGKSDAEILDEFHRRAFAAPPSAAELAKWLRARPAAPAERQAWQEDILWAMLLSDRFTHNH